jgi:hypothetical protein
LLPEISVNATPKIRLKVETGMPRGLVDREIGRSRECRRDTAQPETAFAVSPQDAVPAAAGSF